MCGANRGDVSRYKEAAGAREPLPDQQRERLLQNNERLEAPAHGGPLGGQSQGPAGSQGVDPSRSLPTCSSRTDDDTGFVGKEKKTCH